MSTLADFKPSPIAHRVLTLLLLAGAAGCQSGYTPAAHHDDAVSAEPAIAHAALPQAEARPAMFLSLPGGPMLLSYSAGSQTASLSEERGSVERMSRVTFADQGADFDPCISHDGHRLVFASTRHRTTSDIYTQLVGSRVVTQLTSDSNDDVMPSISPDGTRIAFSSNRGGDWDIYVMPVSGGQAVQVTADPAPDLHATWSPDGTHLVFSRLGEVSGKWEMWVVEAGNSSSLSFIGYGLFPSWSPIGGTGAGGADRIMFQLSRERGDRAFSIWTLDFADGRTTNLTELAASPTMAYINPSWSPDGQRIVYAAVPLSPGATEIEGQRPISSDLWMMNIDGTGKVHLGGGVGTALMPAWGANNQVYFVSNRGGIDNIWSMNMGSAVLAAGRPTPATRPAIAAKPAATRRAITANAQADLNPGATELSTTPANEGVAAAEEQPNQ
ncbi:MAG: PD40 domain-containing protein [Phycisphaerales bacterium]|nr:PD40 domain-containing protein [Phycisphaerales bacterium]